jgi:hypothetical protein
VRSAALLLSNFAFAQQHQNVLSTVRTALENVPAAAAAGTQATVSCTATMEADSCVPLMAHLLCKCSLIAVFSGNSDHLALGDPSMTSNLVVYRNYAHTCAAGGTAGISSVALGTAAASSAVFNIVNKSALCNGLCIGSLGFGALNMLALCWGTDYTRRLQGFSSVHACLTIQQAEAKLQSDANKLALQALAGLHGRL